MASIKLSNEQQFIYFFSLQKKIINNLKNSTNCSMNTAIRWRQSRGQWRVSGCYVRPTAFIILVTRIYAGAKIDLIKDLFWLSLIVLKKGYIPLVTRKYIRKNLYTLFKLLFN